MSIDLHSISIKTLPDIRGVVHHARCHCGWRGANHPGTPGAVDPGRRAAEMEGTFHLQEQVQVAQSTQTSRQGDKGQ